MIKNKEDKTLKNKPKLNKDIEKEMGLFRKLYNNVYDFFTKIDNRQQIEIYKQKIKLVTPVSGSRRIANCNIGDFIIIVEDKVMVYDYLDDKREHYSPASYTPEFVRLNPNLFEKQTK